MTGEVAYLYCDGGLLDSNPSKLGGTWAWCALDDVERVIAYDCGLVLPEDIGLPVVTNNLTELYAAYRALNVLGTAVSAWKGQITTDSMVTALRLNNANLKGVPSWLKDKIREIRRFKHYRIRLVRGHPTKSQLESGWANGLAVSKWNVWCDTLCNEVSEAYWKERAA